MEKSDLLNASMDDIVFESRNKSYGAYVLRKLYDRHMTRGFIIGTFHFGCKCAIYHQCDKKLNTRGERRIGNEGSNIGRTTANRS